MGEFSDLVVAGLLGFIGGFKVAVWLDRKHLNRMRKIWTGNR